jgi:hypothetical protein
MLVYVGHMITLGCVHHIVKMGCVHPIVTFGKTMRRQDMCVRLQCEDMISHCNDRAMFVTL